MFYLRESLWKMLVSSLFGRPVCSREKRRDGGKKRGRPMECRGCVAGFAHGNCVSEIVSTQATFPWWQLFGRRVFQRTLPTQYTGVWNRSHTKTFERANFDLLTPQKYLAASIEDFLTWCRPKNCCENGFSFLYARQ